MITILLPAVLAAALPLQDSKKDVVVPRNGSSIEGTVQKETWKEVTVSTAAGTQAVKSDAILRIEYYDAPGAFRGAMATIEQENWSEALASLGRAEEEANSKEKGVVKPRSWFGPALAFYRGLCLMRTGKTDEAIQQFADVRATYKESRFLIPSYELTLEVHRERGDLAAMDAFEQEIEATAPAEVKNELKFRIKRQRAEALFDKDQYAEAKALFEEIGRASDPDISAEGSAGVIKCLSRLKDQANLDMICKRVLTTSTHPVVLLTASNAMGDIFFDQKEYVRARDYYVASVVKYNPGRTGTGIEREHERALYHLARCHEEIMNAASDVRAKAAYQRMAASAYRELSVEYPSGRFRDEAAAKAQQLEVKEQPQ